MEDFTNKTCLSVELTIRDWVEDHQRRGDISHAGKAAMYRSPSCVNFTPNVSGSHSLLVKPTIILLTQASWSNHWTTAKPSFLPPIPPSYCCFKYRLVTLLPLLYINIIFDDSPLPMNNHITIHTKAPKESMDTAPKLAFQPCLWLTLSPIIATNSSLGFYNTGLWLTMCPCFYSFYWLPTLY